MPIEVRMPSLSPSMTEGTLARWLKKQGEPITSGEIIAEIETDKALVDLEAESTGILGKIFVADGAAGVKVDAVLGLILQPGEALPAPAPAAKPIPSNAPATTAVPVTPELPPLAPASHNGRRFASPVARRLAAQRGIDLRQLTGSGPNGRIIKSDVAGFVPAVATAAATVPTTPTAKTPATPANAPTPVAAAFDEIAHTGMRRVIAQRLSESKQTVPHFYLTVDCTLDALLALRQQVNATAEDVKISVNDFVVKAIATALRRVPAANASWTEDCVRQYKTVDISVAVATPGGLLTPVVRDADKKSIGAISAEIKSLAERARAGKLLPVDYQGGTFTISNLGMYGVKSFSAIINPPQACILAVGAGDQRPVVKDGQLAVATVMSCTLSVDHRVVDGAVGAEFLAAFRQLIEAPMGLLI